MPQPSLKNLGSAARNSEAFAKKPRSRVTSLASSGGASLLTPAKFPWQNERARILRHICKRLVSESRTIAIDKLSARYARQYSEREYKSASGKRIQLGGSTILRVYYLWLEKGEAAFALDYKPRVDQIPAKMVSRLIKIAARPDFASVQASIRTLQKLSRPAAAFTPGSFSRRIPANIRKQLACVAKQRKNLKAEEARLSKLIKALDV